MSTQPFRAAIATAATLILTAHGALAQVTPNVDSGVGGVNPVAAAQRSGANAAKADLDRALGGLRAAQERVQADFKAAPELWQAESDLEAAQAELDLAQKPVLDRLTDSPEYKDEWKKQQEHEATIQREFQKSVAADPASTKPADTTPATADPTDNISVTAERERLNVPVPSDAQIAAATDKAVQRNKLRQLQEAAIKADPAASEAAKKVETAVENLKRLQLTHRAALLNNPEFKAALDQVHSARARIAQAASANYGYGAYGSYNSVR